MPVPKYSGRYPVRCPNCGEELFPMNEALDVLVDQLFEDGEEASDITGSEENVPKIGIIFDKLMQKVNAFELLDPFVGAETSDSARQIRLYFSDSAKQEQLDRLANEFKGQFGDAGLFRSDIEDAKYLVLVDFSDEEGFQGQSGDQPSGDDIDLSGNAEVEVSSDESPLMP